MSIQEVVLLHTFKALDEQGQMIYCRECDHMVNRDDLVHGLCPYCGDELEIAKLPIG
jgi:Zn finger protein HypA/HybF involved in hydrogenase expression